MIKIEKTEVYGWEAAIRGMRNPMNSWGRSDSDYRTFCSKMCDECGRWDIDDDDTCEKCEKFNEEFLSPPNEEISTFCIGPNDFNLMLKLAKGGPVHAKYRRMITATADITAPLYWWKEFDTYKVGTVANSCSTMHKIHAKEFTLDDFSHEHMFDTDTIADQSFVYDLDGCSPWVSLDVLGLMVKGLNFYRKKYLETNDKKYWWQMIQLLPSSYNQKRTVMLNYETLSHIYPDRKDHKLDEWRTLCYWIEILPYSRIITLKSEL